MGDEHAEEHPATVFVGSWLPMVMHVFVAGCDDLLARCAQCGQRCGRLHGQGGTQAVIAHKDNNFAENAAKSTSQLLLG
ncbi:hypothetical protein CCHOA_09330 [Corynebacterium choanae]|uniref:Uncharacterized protein n=1 Tax=Corynebacterium choanae TaxID=1862358 RepID=A0A3G6J8L7_9CORY|nr:hypothetical protein CCHOA_09330 [Corynebacterium choanae]